jgi:hypothetical protein
MRSFDLLSDWVVRQYVRLIWIPKIDTIPHGKQINYNDAVVVNKRKRKMQNKLGNKIVEKKIIIFL